MVAVVVVVISFKENPFKNSWHSPLSDAGLSAY